MRRETIGMTRALSSGKPEGRARTPSPGPGPRSGILTDTTVLCAPTPRARVQSAFFSRLRARPPGWLHWQPHGPGHQHRNITRRPDFGNALLL